MIATRIHMQGIIAHLSWVYDLWKVSEKNKIVDKICMLGGKGYKGFII